MQIHYLKVVQNYMPMITIFIILVNLVLKIIGSCLIFVQQHPITYVGIH